MNSTSEVLYTANRRILVLELAVVLLATRCGDAELARALIAATNDIDDAEASTALYALARHNRVR